MGGLAGAAGARRLSAPVWLVGGEVDLVVAADAPTVWLVDIDEPVARRRAEAVTAVTGELVSFANRGDAGERLLRRHLARLLLAAAAGCPAEAVRIERTAAGAPVVAFPTGWHLSVAARWPACLIGVAPFPLGIDIERHDPEPLPADLLTAAEQHQVAAMSPAERARHAARCWAAKEAHAKWTGEPRRVDPALVETAMPPLVRSPWGETRCWLHDRGDHVAAVCTA